MKFRLDNAALAEIETATSHYREIEPALGIDYVKAVNEAIEGILHSPMRFPVGIAGTRRHSLRRFPYHVVYLVHTAEVVIVAVSHDRREKEYWRSRVR